MLIVLPSITSNGLAVGGTPTGLAMTWLAATTKARARAATAKLLCIALPPHEYLGHHTRAAPTAANASPDTEADRLAVPKPQLVDTEIAPLLGTRQLPDRVRPSVAAVGRPYGVTEKM